MKQALFILLTLILTSCGSTYYYSTLNTTSEYVKKVENGDFLLETDSLWIAHCFKGENAPMQITIFNKLDVPLLIDWGYSGIVINKEPYTYDAEYAFLYEDSIQASVDDKNPFENKYDNHFNLNDSKYSGQITILPPSTMVSNNTLHLNPNLKDVDKKLYKEASMGDKDHNVKRIQRAYFEEEDSPLKFTSHLTIYSPDSLMTFKQDFYLSNTIKTKGITPKNIEKSLTDKGDLFYIKQPASTDALTMFGLAGLAGVIVIAVLSNSGSDGFGDYNP